MDLITSNILKTKEYRIFSKSIQDGFESIYITGLDFVGTCFFSRAFFTGAKNPNLIVVPTDLDAKRFYEDMQAVWEELKYLPVRETVYFDSFAHSNEISNQRMDILARIIKGDDITVVASMEALMVRQIDLDVFEDLAYEFKIGNSYNMENLAVELLRLGYERVDKIEFKGSYCIKGGIIDIFDPQYDNPIRMEFFDDEIDSIRKFNIFTQTSIEKIDNINIFPAKEIVLSEKMKTFFLKQLNTEFKNDKLSGELRTKIENLIGHIEIIGYFDKLELFTEYFCSCRVSLIDYFSDKSTIILVNPEKIIENSEALIENNLLRFENYFSKGMLLKNQYKLFLSKNEFLRSISKKTNIFIDNLQKNLKDFSPNQIIAFRVLEAPVYHGKIFDFIDDVKRWSYNGYKIAVFIDDDLKIASLKDQLISENIPVSIKETIDANLISSQCVLIKKTMSRGIIFDSIKFVVITENELFSIAKGKKLKKEKNKKIIKSFTELKKGDLVVHEAHGIGRYIGIEQLSVENVIKDYFKIMYSGDGFLYIPIDQMNLIQKYIGGEEKKVKLHKMGGTEWKKAKTNARKVIEDMTEELLLLYAERKSKIGYEFSKDSTWQKELEDMFPYEETNDQLKCIDEIKMDMEKKMPMDRLLCGDVGFGKTEVAIRAAFKAVNDSKQVAFLVPTTILAQQHYNTIKERFSKFPVNIQVLSRFKTKKEQEVIVENMRTGNVDVIIGTHRLLSKDIEFKDLGLLIIDEEQRFGVKHKEKIKQIKTNVDVLTLTATPIPRTLHMSLIGIRDMSIIEDPPEDRYPIQTYVVEENELLLKEAIEKEISRGGQVYYVYNNVKNIDYVTEKLQNLVPGARINHAHGQMNEGKLEKIMYSFLGHEFDVLVCTTIIETGLDISNVNTIIIDNADKMGISQLYQLRGRVGRSNRIAYAYLFYKKNKILSEIAEKRLKGIKEFTELGSGFKIAMRDLEIRGSGNILGSDQHGQIDSVGYEYYCKMLEEAVGRVKGEVIEEVIETEIDFVINAFIPEEFVKSGEDKIEIYKKIASIRNKEDAYSIEEEVEDRYGTLPSSVYNLIGISQLKALAQKIGIIQVKEKNKAISLKFSDSKMLNKDIIEKITVNGKNRVEFDLSEGYVLEYKFYLENISKEAKLKEITDFLEKIVV